MGIIDSVNLCNFGALLFQTNALRRNFFIAERPVEQALVTYSTHCNMHLQEQCSLVIRRSGFGIELALTAAIV